MIILFYTSIYRRAIMNNSFNHYESSFNDDNINHIIKIIKKTKEIDTFDFSEKDLINSRKEISCLYPLHVFYRFLSKIVIKQYLLGMDMEDMKILDPISKIYGKGREFSIFEPHYINLDTGFFINKFIKDNKIKSVLNCGTGAGSSVAYSLVGNDVHVTTLEHIHEFTKITQYYMGFLRNMGVPISNNIDYLDVGLCSVMESEADGIESLLFKKVFEHAYSKNHNKYPFVSYDVSFDKKFDTLILDGPSFFRFPTLLKMLNYINDDGYVIFEYCRQELKIVKDFKIPIISEKGRKMSKSIKLRSSGTRVEGKAITIMKSGDMKKRIKEILKES